MLQGGLSEITFFACQLPSYLKATLRYPWSCGNALYTSCPHTDISVTVHLMEKGPSISLLSMDIVQVTILYMDSRLYVAWFTMTLATLITAFPKIHLNDDSEQWTKHCSVIFRFQLGVQQFAVRLIMFVYQLLLVSTNSCCVYCYDCCWQTALWHACLQHKLHYCQWAFGFMNNKNTIRSRCVTDNRYIWACDMNSFSIIGTDLIVLWWNGSHP